jgi:heme exporter protein A
MNDRDTTGGSGDDLLEAIDLGCERGGRRLFSGFGLRLGAGESLQIEGANGSGKTSLLRILGGLLRASEGAVRWRGTDVTAPGGGFRGSACYVGHDDGVKAELSARENLRFSARVAGRACDEAEALTRVGLGGFEDVPLRQLSAGQQRRAALARLLIGRAPLWLLDEPFATLDAGGRRMVESLLAAHAAAGGLAVVTTHQPIDVRGPVRSVVLG